MSTEYDRLDRAPAIIERFCRVTGDIWGPAIRADFRSLWEGMSEEKRLVFSRLLESMADAAEEATR